MADAPENPTRISGESGWTPLPVERLQEVLPAYEVIELLGAGGMGAVYKARQKSLKRLVAIKILPTAGADDDFQFVERFRNEAETLAQMNHPAIVNVYDFGETPNGLLYFVMEFVDGTDVHKMIQSSGKLSAEHALSITAHVCDALAYAHRHGVIHRDIKPANILINREGHVKVADFGLAKMHDPSQTSGLTRTNMTMGTPDYAAPEVFKPGMVTDHRADLYAVGVMLYQMLTGEVPRGFFKLPSESGTDPRFDAIIVKAMEANRDERFQSALEVRHALDEILTTPLAKNDGTGVISARSLPQRSRVAPKPQPAPSSKAKWFVAAAIVAVLGGAGFFLLDGKDEPLAKTQPPASERPASPAPVPEKGRTIDLLALVDVKRDAIVGEWSRSPRGVAVAIPAGASVLQLPYRPPEEYDFEIEFTPSNAGLNVNQYLSAGGRSFAWKLNAHNRTPPLYGFELLDGKFCKDLTEAAANIATAIEPGRRYRSVVEVRRGGLRGLLDGKEIVKWSGDFSRFSMEGVTRLRDDEHLGIGSWKRDVTFHKVEVREITGAGKVDARPASTGAPTIDWLKKDIWRAPWVVEQGALKTTSKDALMRIGQIADGTIRVRLRDVGVPATAHSPPLQFMVRFAPITGAITKDAHYLFQIFPQKRTCTLIYLEKSRADGVEKTETLWMGKALPATKDLDFEIRAEGDALSVWAEGKVVGSAIDARLKTGKCRMIASPGIEITRLETVGVTDDDGAAAPDDVQKPLPAISNWQDVIEAAREAARSQPMLVVEPDAIRHSGSGASPHIPLTREGVRDYAVRLRFSGDGQVSLRTNPAGFIYVLCQRTQMIFQRYDKGALDPAVLRPGVVHPKDYDAAKPHELLVTMQGSTIRAWLDGRFVAEAHEETFKDGTAGVAFTKWSVVQKVEIAELSTPEAWTDWLGPKLAAGGFAGGQWKREAGGISTDQTLAGFEVLPTGTRDGAMRVTFAMRDSEGVIIDAREVKEGAGRHLYNAQYTGKNLYIAHSPPDARATKRLINEPVADELRARDEHTLEFRFVGDELTAVLDDTHRITTRHSLLPAGPCAVVLTKGVLLKRVEVTKLSEPSLAASWQSVFTKPEDFGGDLRDVEFRDGATFLKGRSVFAPLRSAEGAIRATLRYFEADRTGSLTIRTTDAAYGQESFACTAFVSGKGTNVAIHLRDKTAGIVEPQRTDFPQAPAIREGELFTMELSAENGQVTVRVNGRDIGTVKDSWKAGNRRFGITPSNTLATEFRDVAVKASSGAVK